MPIKSIFQRHSFFSKLKSEEYRTLTKDSSLNDIIFTKKNPIAKRDRVITEKIKPHIKALPLQSKNISNGLIINPDEICIPEAEIKASSLLHSVDKNKLKSEFRKAIKNLPAENNLEKINAMLKTIANFMGGGLITGGNKDTQLDGFIAAANFDIWEWLLTSVGEHLNPEENLRLEKVKGSIDKLKQSAHFFKDLYHQPFTPKETTEKVHAASLEYAKKVQNLKPGEAEFFSGGWTNMGGAGGHAQIYEIQRRNDGTLNVSVYTSTGFQLTEFFLGGCKTRLKPLIRYEKVPDNVLFFGEKDQISPVFIQGLMEINILALKNPNLSLGENNVLGVLDHLESYRVSVPIADAGVISGQLGGTCSPSVTKQFIRYHLGSKRLHSKVMFHIKLKLLTSFYCAVEKKLAKKNPICEKSRRALIQDARKLLRISIKLKEQNLLTPKLFAQARATAQDILKRVGALETDIAARRKTKVSKSAWKNASHESQRKDRREMHPKAEWKAPETQANKMTQPDLSIKVDLVNNCAQSLSDALNITKNKCYTFNCATVAGNRSLSTQVAHLIDQLPLPGTPEAETFWNQFSLNELQKTQKDLFELSEFYSNAKCANDLLERRFATIMPLQVLVHFLAVQIDTRLAANRKDSPEANLANYKIPSYVDILKIEGLQFFDRRQFNRLVQASNYLENHNNKASQAALFISERNTKIVEKEKIVDEEDVELNNGHYWKALVEADSNLKKAVTLEGNEKWPDFTEEFIRRKFAEKKTTYNKRNEEIESWERNPKGEKPKELPVPTPLCNLPEQTKHTLIMDSVSMRENFLDAHGYGHITYFRGMNSIANGWLYASESPVLLRSCSANQGNLSSARLGFLFHTKQTPTKDLLQIAKEGNRDLNDEHKNFLEKSLCQRDISKWEQPVAEGKVLINDHKNAFLDKFLRPLSQWEIAPEQLIYELEKEWYARRDVDLLEDPSFQGLFYRLFFRSPVTPNGSIELGFGDLIVKNAALREALGAFINKGFARIQTQKMSFNSARFFFELSFHTAKYLSDASLHEEAEKFSQLAPIKSYLNNAQEMKPNEEAALHLYQVLFYSIKKNLSVEEQASLFASWSLHQIFPKSESKFKAMGIYHIAYDYILHQIDIVSHLPCQELGKLIAEKVKILPLVENAQWDLDAHLGFPYLTDGNSKMNLLSGEMFRPEGPVLGVPKDFHWESEEDFKRLFKKLSNVRYEALGNDCIGFTIPDKGTFRLIKTDRLYLYKDNNNPRILTKNKKYLIQKRIAGKWYEYQALNEWGGVGGFNKEELQLLREKLNQNENLNEEEQKRPFPQPLVHDHAYWIPVDQIDPQVKGLFTDLKELKPLYQNNADGTIVELKPDGLTIDYIDAKKGELAGFEKFEKLENILTYRKEEALQKVVFPAYQSLDGNSLAFECQNEKLLWTENREYEIGSTMQKGILDSFKNYLYLTSTKDPKRTKLLVPLRPIVEADTPATTCQIKDVEYPLEKTPNGNEMAASQRFLTFDCVDGVIKATSIESRCALAYLYLAQKKYEEAAIILKGIKATEELTETAELILNRIQKLPEGEDHPDGKMVRLHAFYICLNRAEKKSLTPVKDLLEKEKSLASMNVISALQNNNNISAACRFSKESEIHLLTYLIKNHEDKPSNLRERLAMLQGKEVKPTLDRYTDGKRSINLTILSSNYFVSDSAKKLIQDPAITPEIKVKKAANIKVVVDWLKDGFIQFKPNEERIHSTISPETLEKDGRLFLEVYNIAKGSSSLRRQEMHYRLWMWKKFAGESTHFLDILLLMTKHPEKFPPLVQKSSSDIDLFNFLLAVDEAYLATDKIAIVKYERNLEIHDPKTPTEYPILLNPTFEKTLKLVSDINPDKIPLRVKFDAQCDRWEQLKQWKDLLTEDKKPHLQKENDFRFNPENVLKQHENNYKGSLKRDFEILSEDYRQGKKQNLEAKSKILSKENCIKIKTQAQDQIKNLAAKRKDIEVKLLAMANQHSAIELAKLGGKVATWMHFQDCVDCLLSFDARSYIQKNENLTSREANEIAQMTLQTLDLKSHEAQLKRIVGLADEIQSCAGAAGKAVYRSLCLQIETELGNQYHFDSGFNAEEQAVLRIFAGQAEIMPFKKQIELIKKMLQTDPANPSNVLDLVIQLIMGGGKTSVIAVLMLILAAKRKGRLAFFIVPAALLKTVTVNLRDALMKAFGKELLSIDLEREEFTPFRLKDTLKVLEQAEKNQQPVIVSATTLQGLELELLSISRQLKETLKIREILSKKVQDDDNDNEINQVNATLAVLQEKATLLNKILRITESKADSLIDEVDLILDSLQELNFVDGQKISINSTRNGLLLNIYKSMLSKKLIVKTMPGNPSIDDVIRLWDLQRPHLDPKDHLLHIVPLLAQNLAETYKPFIRSIPKTYKNSFVRYTSGLIPAGLEKCMKNRIELTDAYVKENFKGCTLADLKNDLEFLQYLYDLKDSHRKKDKELADLIAITKHFLTELTPACLEKEGGRDFGVDGKNPGKIIPYVGVLAPASTEFGYHWENAAYHYQYGAAFKPDKEMILSLASLWISTAKHFVSENGEKFEETPEYKTFFKLFGVNLDTIYDEGIIEKAIENLFKDREKCLDLQFELANRYAGYASERLTSNGFALCDLLASRLSMSGTPWNAEGYNQKLARRIIQDIGTEGRILHKLAERASSAKIIEVDQPKNIQEFLQQVYARYAAQNLPFNKIQAIIEAGGIFKGFGNNSTIAKGWLDFISQKQAEEKDLTNKTVDPGIEAVLFFGAEADEVQQNTLYVWRKGATQPEKVGGTTLEALNAKGLDPSKYLVFIDEVHGTGIDIPLRPDARSIVTFDDMTTRKAIQNIMRCRKFLLEQDVDFVINKETRASLHNQGKTIEDLFINAAKKQSITKTESMVRYFTQQIHHIFRKHAIQIVRESIDKNKMNDLEFVKCVENAEKFFVSYMEELPFQQHGRLIDEVDTKSMLLEILSSKHRTFKQLINIPEVLAKVEKDVLELSTWIQESKVLPAKWKSPSDTIGFEQENEQKVQLNQKVEIKVEIEIEIENELMQYLKEKSLVVTPELEMTKEKFRSLLEEMKKPAQSSKVISLKNQLSAYEYKFNDKLHPYQNCFEEPIYGTKAYFHTTENEGGLSKVLPVFHPSQRPPKQILAVRHEGQMSWLLLSEHEARDASLHLEALYKDEKQAPEAWLIQLDGTAFVKNPESFPLEDAPVTQGLLELNFLAGHLSYLDARQNRDEFASWLETETELKVRFLKLQAQQDPVQKQHFSKCEPIKALLDSKMLKNEDLFEKLMCKKRHKKAKNFKGTLLLEKPEKVKLLPQRLIGQLKVEQVPLLGMDLAANDPITAKAVKKLAKLKKLNEAEEITAAAKVHTKNQFSALQAYQVPYLTPEQMPWLPKSKVRYILEPEQIYQDLIVGGVATRKYLLTKEQVEGLKVDQQDFIPYVNPQFYSQFDENWQIAAIPVEELNRINPKQASKITPQQIRQFTPEIMTKIPELIKELTINQLQMIDLKLHNFIPEERYKELSTKQIDDFGSDGYNQLPDNHKLWQLITPNAISFLTKEKIKNIAKEQYCHLKREDAIASLSKFDFIHLNKIQLAKRKSSFILYFLGIMTLGVAACVVSAIAYVTLPFIWLANREKGRKFHQALSLNFKRVSHLFSTYIPALFY